MRVLITATSELASHLAATLSARGAEVAILERRLFRTHLFDRVHAADRVFHLLGATPQTSAARSFAALAETDEVLAACAAFDRPLLLATSSELYGRTVCGVAKESDALVLPPDPSAFAVANLFAERAALEGRGSPVVIARLFDLAGPRAPGVLGRLVAAAEAGRPLEVHGTGQQERAFMHLTDAAEILARLMETPAAVGRAVNVGGTCATSIIALARRLRQLTPGRPPIALVPPSATPDDLVPCRLPCLARLRSLVGALPERTLDQLLISSLSRSAPCSLRGAPSPSP